VGVKDQKALLKSSDPKLAANKKLVFDMYRAIVNGGHTEMADQFFTKEYIQHNPNVKSGRDELVAYIKTTRPARPLTDDIAFPVIALVAEGDMVVVATVAMIDDAENPGQRYANTHFDMYRIENGKIAEHWDHVERSKRSQSFDPNTTSRGK
jgi:predicted SnoaL-like aldol condensation-catalyzing enzyme